MNRCYVVIKNNTNEVGYLKYEKLEGYKFRPLNHLPSTHSIKVSKVILYQPELIEIILRKKIKHKLIEYLKLILMDVDDDSTSDASYVRAVLNDLTRYRQLIINNYRKYLEEQYLEVLLAKISLIEEELKHKLVYLLYPKEVEEEKRRGR